MRTIAIAAALLACAAPQAAKRAAEETEPTSREVFQEAQGFLVRRAGRWVSANRGYEPGGPGPRWFGLEFEWAPEPHAVLGRIYGIAPDGATRQYWTTWTVWNPARGGAVHFQMSGGGTWVEGPVSFESARVHRVAVEGARPDGTPVRFEDGIRETGPDSMQTQTTLWQDGAWHEGPVESWRRVESFDPASWPEGVGEAER